MSPEFMASLAEGFQNITGLKQANNGDMGPIEGLDVLAGNDDIFARCLREGGTGGILVASHVVGPRMREIFDASAEGDHDGALDGERELSGIYSAIACAPPASSVKAILSMRGLIGETQRLPMVPVSGPAREALQEIAEND
jgi:4-hydroxy-tetrahydrodipicolinate synthase